MKKVLIVFLLGILSVTAFGISTEDKENLVFMYKEEKLAYDLYDYFSEIYSHRVFNNIKKSEGTHMERVKDLLISYQIDVPNLKPGVYNNKELDDLYKELSTYGEKSLKNAFEVGIIVEKKDIADLEEAMKNAPADIRIVYSNLLKGSKNHLKSFSKF